MSNPRRFTFGARVASFRYAFQGLRYVLRTQHNARLHMAATLFVLGLGIGFQISGVDWCLVVLAAVGVWTAEAFNTALECLTDLVCPETHPVAGRAKDVSAAAVLLSAFGAAIVGMIVFTPHVIAWLN